MNYSILTWWNIMQILQIMLAESFWWFVNVLMLQCLMKSNMKKVIYQGLSLNNRENGWRKYTRMFQRLLMMKSIISFDFCFSPRQLFLVVFLLSTFIQANSHSALKTYCVPYWGSTFAGVFRKDYRQYLSCCAKTRPLPALFSFHSINGKHGS